MTQYSKADYILYYVLKCDEILNNIYCFFSNLLRNVRNHLIFHELVNMQIKGLRLWTTWHNVT